MLESLALALVKSLTAYLFKTYVYLTSNIRIDGAPDWYLKNVSSAVCVYDVENGGLESVDAAKANSYTKMQTELSKIIQTVVYDSYRNLKDPKEKAFVNTFINDPDAGIFINKTLVFRNIDYNKKKHITFVQGCIDKQAIIDYQTERADKIRYELTHMRADNAFDDLDNGNIDIK